jgi:hypothetical protein
VESYGGSDIAHVAPLRDLSEATEPTPILVEWPGENGQPRYEAVWYIPGESGDVDWDELSPGEKGAISQLLGPEYEDVVEEVI